LIVFIKMSGIQEISMTDSHKLKLNGKDYALHLYMCRNLDYWHAILIGTKRRL
jgi:hypothetical protein